jgi:Transmembrane domain of unknown function (DUF3566)
MSKTERAIDGGVDALDDDLLVDDLLDDDLPADDEVVIDVGELDDGIGDVDAHVDEVVETVDEVVEVDDDDHDDDRDDGDDLAAGDEPYELPEIILATEDDEPGDPAPDHALDADLVTTPVALDPGEVSDDVLEELRRADIDGPTVELAPQDDTSSGIRRPRRSPDYDPAPYPIPVAVPRLLGRKPRVRRVTRVVRHVDPWSVFKIAFVANLVLYLIVLTAGVLLWNVAYATGTVDNVERFLESFGWSTFEFNGGQIYHSAWIGGLFVVIGLTGLAVLLATMFNLITDLVGGMRFTVLEEEVVETRTSPMRRFVVRRAEPEVPVVMYDESGPIVREATIDDSGAFGR